MTIRGGGNSSHPRRFLRLREAASYLALSPWKFRQLLAAGEIPFIQLEPGGPYQLDIRDLDQFAEKHKRNL
jgi:excisionase family DNA binding protein